MGVQNWAKTIDLCVGWGTHYLYLHMLTHPVSNALLVFVPIFMHTELMALSCNIVVGNMWVV